MRQVLKWGGRGQALWATALLGAALLLVCLATASAEQLPVKTYTTADGLLRDEALRIKQDSRGFLWLCTNDGVSRFDGYGFTNYTTDDGLPHRVVNDLLETRAGVIWMATNGGLARFNPKGKRGLARNGHEAPQPKDRNAAEPMFVTYLPEENASHTITVLFEDARGRLWCGTVDGLYWFEEQGRRGVFHRVALPKERPKVPSTVSAIIQDRRGHLWVGMDEAQGLNRLWPDGRIEHYATRQASHQSKSIKTLLETREGEVWVGTSDGGLCSLVSAPDPQRPVFSRCYAKQDGLPANWIGSLYQTADGKLWVGTANGAASFDPHSSTTPRFRVYGEAQGLCDEGTSSWREDREGNLWAATTRGVKKIVRGSFVRYSESDGLASASVNSLFVSPSGELFVITARQVESEDKRNLRSIHLVSRFDGHRFTSVRPNLPTTVGTGWGGWQVVVKDRTGQWWFPSDKNVAFRFPQVSQLEQLSSARPRTVGIPDREVFRLYEDSRGDIWISTMYKLLLLRWERSTETIRDEANAAVSQGASFFAEDKEGAVWIGFAYSDHLARYQDGRFTLRAPQGEKSGGAINSLYFDHAGRLWLSSSLNGVGRVDDPQAEGPLQVVWYNRRKGLATDSTLGLAEDNFGRIYVGHARGVDRLDPRTGQIKHYTAADGLPPGTIYHLARDAQGAVWFGGRGLARLVPEPDRPRPAPTILLTGLRVAGAKQPVSELGEESLPALTLDPSQTQVSVDFLGLGASLGEELKYQYRLEGAQGAWSEPAAQRTVDFANLAPGAYRLWVKAITAEGTESSRPAVFTFTILRPLWQRPWFLLLVATAVALLLYAVYRYRIARLLELERVRMRIATDLHDDIGSNLSLIAMLSEVARREYREDGRVAESLALIAGTSRELVDSMSDIVWAVNPKKDSLRELTQRMRRFASELFTARHIAFKFLAPAEGPDLKLGTDTRREVFLIFKEALNNIARHAACSEAEIELQVTAGWLVLRLSDNGQGFDTAAASEGNGLLSMRQRAQKLGGEFELNSNGQGTTVALRVPLSRWG